MSSEHQKMQFRYQGVALALASLHRQHGEPNMVCDVMRSHGLILDDLKRAGVPEYDLYEIRHCLSQGNADDRAQVPRDWKMR